ncbi:hypothetical protein ABZ567_05665 [Streptomyces sp. NPDC016459]|uniref:hypothetical protein n=1 Tax=Streptomyces sp. NPDC016459 TaxID=3157190 RepID=UPI0033F76605
MTRIRMAVVIATALVVGVAPASLGGATALAAPTHVTGAAGASAGTVVQEGGPLVVPSGEEGPVTTRVKVAQYGATSERLQARLLLPSIEYAAGDEDHSFDTTITATCAVNGGAFQPCPWGSGDWGSVAVLPTTTTVNDLTYDIRLDASSSARKYGTVTATLEALSEEGVVHARGPVSFTFVQGTPEAYLRTTVLARDKAGVLWQYPSSGHADKPLRGRKRIGGGWNVYTSLTTLTHRTAAGEGDLVVRDKDGVLWYYEGSGNPDAPFKPRVRIGGGWNTYTAITGRGRGVVARDKDGVLWQYAPTYRNDSVIFYPRRMVGGGWNAYTAITGRGAGYNAVARDTSGVLWSYGYGYAPSGGPYGPRVKVGGGWNAYNALAWTQKLGGESYDELLARDGNGYLWLYQTVYRDDVSIPTTRKQIGWGWGIYDAIL